jgi:hypothetical protein
MKSAQIFFLLLFYSLCCRAQNVPCYFIDNIGSSGYELSQSIVEMDDGSIYVAGKVSDGPYGLNDVTILKLDSCGNLLWQKYYGDSTENAPLFINKTRDKKLVVTGEIGNAFGYNDIFLWKLDTSGNLMWQARYDSAITQSAKYVEQTSDSGFVLCGYIDDGNGSLNTCVIKTDANGSLIWLQQIGGSLTEYADAVHETPEGNILVTGDTKSNGNGGYDVEVIKFRQDGSIIWDQTFGDNLNNGCQGIIVLSDGNYLVFGETEIYPNSPYDFFIEYIDTAGNSLGRHVFGGSATDALFSLVEMPGKNFLCTGYSRSYNGGQAYDMVLFKIDSAGTMKWLKNNASPGIDIGYQLLKSNFGGFLLTGLFADQGTNIFVMRSDTVANTSVGIPSVEQEHFLKVFPSPFQSNFSVLINANLNPAEVVVVNSIGETVLCKQAQSGENNFSLGNFPNGIYTILLKANGKLVASSKICKIN